MTVNELIEKLEKIKAQGYGNDRVVVGVFYVDGSFKPESIVNSCYGYTCPGKANICGLSTIGGSKLAEAVLQTNRLEVRDDA